MTDPMRHLACGCSRRISLKAHPIDDEYSEAYCAKHGDAYPITATALQEWHAFCLTPGCWWGRWCGSRMGAASWQAGGHAQRHPGHATRVEYDTHTRDGRGALREPLRREYAPTDSSVEGLFPAEYAEPKNNLRTVDDAPPF